jgi:hypothetical protein
LGSQLTTAEDLSGGASLEALLRGVWSMGVGGSAFHGPWLDGGLRSVPCGSITMGDCSRSVVLSDHLASGRRGSRGLETFCIQIDCYAGSRPADAQAAGYPR